MSRRSEDRPVFLLITGPNGSGKTSVAGRELALRRPDVERIVPDDIARQIDAAAPHRAALVATQEAGLRFKAALVGARSVALESLCNGAAEFALLQAAAQAGFRREILFFCAGDAETSISRVAARVQRGGHHVPPAEVIRNHRLAMQSLPKLASSVELLLAFDNSGSLHEAPRLALEVTEGRVAHVSEAPPTWLAHSFRDAAAPLELGADLRRWAADPLRYKVAAAKAAPVASGT